MAAAHAKGGLANAEAYAWHQSLLAAQGDRYDPRIRPRIERGAAMRAADYIDLLNARAAIIQAMDLQTRPYDALIMPTCPLVPPPIAALDDEAEYNRVNILQLRNTTIGNFLDRCAISLPCQRPGEPPVGLMLMGETMADARLFRIAAGVEAALAAAA
jgi:aspartyl-tRNA(Asn)/glutamyl-tRNA(Gln) amidotransferase subunit A